MLELNKLHFGNCLKLMYQIPDKSIGLILCDLPSEMIAPSWDKQIDLKKLWEHYHRILAPKGTIALFSAQPFTAKLISSNEKDFRYVWYWIKNQGTNFFHANTMPIRKVEEICIFKRGKYYPQHSTGHAPTTATKGSSAGRAYHGTNKRNCKGGKTTRFPTNVLTFKCVDNYSRLHTSEKPVDLLEYFIRTYTDETDVVLDNCSGSSPAAEACINLGRPWIMIEKKKSCYNKSVKRIAEVLKSKI